MTTYAIGSVKGNYQALLKLLEKIQFDPENDRLWFTGNLVNEGAESLAVLRFVKDLGKKAVTVLGDQELHLLAVAEGYTQAKAGDTLDEILKAPDRDELLKWLRKRALIHHDSKLNFTLVHAGIPAEWTFSQALTFAYEVESLLSQGNYAALLENLVQDQSRWHAKLRGWKRLRFITNAYTLMKYCNGQGKLDFHTSGALGTQDESLLPWYRLPERMTANLNIIFADDANFEDVDCPGIYPLPTQGGLSALKLSAAPEKICVERDGYILS
ncbi:MAG: symmetrical bis(5'-nucleosyl)-tetraphosphatase [Methylovulum sp.]|uniref:symmetrical bis(5'-nucleosyl)-tetraphosphatase n=1 Tax=Methylovulum sp. TaxID=1916980 RepID=UPI00262E903C|nr:symmetrical bis(5'-nucleosyl)-tetraphosphatase [Methylovulum sp.]MDD2723366.1 symmetrical bis(5'-nucleosyl)-tetraphosphatase [Methylovulum sp.]MDD5124267.1 symmetrical bis(5'-nucleosyl)-tetraphosphatase [Methylovulum sp.]